MSISNQEILKSLSDLAYTGNLLDKDILSKALEEGPKSTDYTELVSFLTNELRSLCNIDEQVNKITVPEDSVSFLMELSSFLKELGCPYENFTQGHISDRFDTLEDRKLLLDYLITELMSARMLKEFKPEERIELKLQETPHAANLKKILSTLRFSKPPANVTMQQLFAKLVPTIEGHIKKGGDALLGNPIFNLTLTEKQWHTLEQVQNDLHKEYTIRREMLLKRLDCTIQSFQWSDKTKGKEDRITKAYCEKRKQLKVEPDVNLSDLLSARDDLAIMEKTSSASVRRNTKSAVNSVIIGQVPDRGGRTNELAPPPPDMPFWQQRSTGGGGSVGNRGGGRGRGSQRGRGDFSRDSGRQSGNIDGKMGGNYNPGGGYDQGRSSGQGQKSYNQGGGYNQNETFNQGEYSNRGQSSYARGGRNQHNQERNEGRQGIDRGGHEYNRGRADYGRGD